MTIRNTSILVSLLLFPSVIFGIGGSAETSFPSDGKLGIELILKHTPSNKDNYNISGVLIIHNLTDKVVSVQSPDNRQVIAFLVTDSLGNVVSPQGNAKVDPWFQMVTIKPRDSYSHKLNHLWFLTGSARFGYEFKSGETYRIVAVFRPKGPGFTSNEVVVKIL